jgi:competence protein ComEC
MIISWFHHVSRSPSRSFTFAALAFCAGVLVGPLFSFASDGLGWPFLIVIVAAVIWRPSETRFILILCVALIGGMLRIGQSDSSLISATFLDKMEKDVRVAGQVRSEVSARISGAQFEMDRLTIAGEPREGAMLVRAPQKANLTDGAEIQFVCRLEAPEPIETFRYDRYLESRGIFAICDRPEHMDVRTTSITWIGRLLMFKSAIVDRLGQLFPEPQASFLSGLLFGGSSALSPELRDDFARTGTAHILAASGFNVSLITLVLLRILLQTRLGRRRALIVTTILLVAYTLMAGATASVVRAALMASVLLVGLWVRREADAANLLLLAAVILLLWNPRQLLGDVGFQLSFAATAALLYVPKRVSRWFEFVPERFGIREAFVGSLAATILTTPIILWHFGTLSIISPLVNLFVLPLIPYVMGGAFLVLVLSILSQTLAIWTATMVWLAGSFQLLIIKTFSALPIASISASHAHALAVVSALVILIGFLWLLKRPAAGHRA